MSIITITEPQTYRDSRESSLYERIFQRFHSNLLPREETYLRIPEWMQKVLKEAPGAIKDRVLDVYLPRMFTGATGDRMFFGFNPSLSTALYRGFREEYGEEQSLHIMQVLLFEGSVIVHLPTGRFSSGKEIRDTEIPKDQGFNRYSIDRNHFRKLYGPAVKRFRAEYQRVLAAKEKVPGSFSSLYSVGGLESALDLFEEQGMENVARNSPRTAVSQAMYLKYAGLHPLDPGKIPHPKSNKSENALHYLEWVYDLITYLSYHGYLNDRNHTTFMHFRNPLLKEISGIENGNKILDSVAKFAREGLYPLENNQVLSYRDIVEDLFGLQFSRRRGRNHVETHTIMLEDIVAAIQKGNVKRWSGLCDADQSALNKIAKERCVVSGKPEGTERYLLARELGLQKTRIPRECRLEYVLEIIEEKRRSGKTISTKGQISADAELEQAVNTTQTATGLTMGEIYEYLHEHAGIELNSRRWHKYEPGLPEYVTMRKVVLQSQGKVQTATRILREKHGIRVSKRSLRKHFAKVIAMFRPEQTSNLICIGDDD
jgi:hypothetical protein